MRRETENIFCIVSMNVHYSPDHLIIIKCLSSAMVFTSQMRSDKIRKLITKFANSNAEMISVACQCKRSSTGNQCQSPSEPLPDSSQIFSRAEKSASCSTHIKGQLAVSQCKAQLIRFSLNMLCTSFQKTRKELSNNLQQQPTSCDLFLTAMSCRLYTVCVLDLIHRFSM